jgi:pyruvate formate lyase activating enzyme
MLRVHSVESFGTSDGPGIRFILFVQGCMFRCLYCQNADTQVCEGGKMMSPDEIMALLERQRPYFGTNGGLTVSGGEPTVQAAELYPLFVKAKAAGIHTALDTNGGFANDDVKKLYEVTDLVILDVKHIDDEGHKKLTSNSNKNTLAMAEFRESQGKPLWIRYVLVPGYNDSDEILHRFGKELQHLKTLERVELLPYHTLGSHKFKEMGRENPLEGVLPPTKDLVLHAKKILEEYFSKVVVH